MKKYLLLILLLIFLTGCTEKIHLEDKYYGTGEYIDIDSSFSELYNSNYVVFVHTDFCSLQVPCENIFEEFMINNNIKFLSMMYDDFKNTNLHKVVKYAPSVIVVKNGKVVAYLDSEKDEDIIKYQDVESFKNWISNYIYLENE